jgi:hypothetical protein
MMSTELMFEIIIDQNKVVLEAVGQLQETIKVLATQKSLDELKAEVHTIKLAVTDTNKDLTALDHRVTVLEHHKH